MDSVKASAVKRGGHSDEGILAALINIPPENVIPGSWKTDLISRDGKRISLKSSQDKKGRSQICLYKLNSDYFKTFVNGSSQRMKDCLVVFPETHEEYLKNKNAIKKLLQIKMIELQRYLNVSTANKKEFLNFIFFTDHDGSKIDFLVITDSKNNFHVFSSEEVLDVFCKKAIITNSVARNAYQLSNLKVIIRGENEKGKEVNLIENEVRTSTHYRTFLSVGNKLKYLYFLSSNIGRRKLVKSKLYLYGQAIKTFRL